MSSATTLAALGSRDVNDTVAASTTDEALVAAGSATQRIRVTSAAISCGASPSTVQFNSKGAGAGTGISTIFQNSIVLPYNPKGWFTTKPGEGLTASTGSGSNTGIQLKWEYGR